MNKIGMSAEDLFMLAISKNLEISSARINDVLDDLKSGKIESDYLQAGFKIAREEAILNTVALMIEENNKTILKQLKELNLVDQE